METILTRVSMFSGAMAGVGDEDEAHSKIHDFVKSWDIREMYLCVDPSICRDVKPSREDQSFPDEMLLLYGIRNGKEYDTNIMPTFDLAPVLQEMRKNTTCLVFCPLYYRDRSFGYVAMNLGNGTGAALYPVLMLLNGTLMSLFLQMNIKRSASIIDRMASHDIMTGLLNRRGYMERAPEIMARAQKEGKYFTLLSADMDHMKVINDQYGHLMGDEAICRMGRALEQIQKMNLTPVHISGDEFLAFGIIDDPEVAQKIIPFVNQELEKINKNDPWICDISASFGIYSAIPKDGDSIDIYMTMADRAMYADKNKRKYGRRKDDVAQQEEKKPD